MKGLIIIILYLPVSGQSYRSPTDIQCRENLIFLTDLISTILAKV